MMTNKKAKNDHFTVFFLPIANKELQKLPETIQNQVMPVIRSLKNPFQVSAIKLKNRDDTFRVRVGDYRVLFMAILKKKSLS